MKKYKIILNYLLIFSLFVFGFIVPFATNGIHINCNSNGDCQYYDSFYYFKTDKTSFKINNNSKISCLRTLNRQDRYNLFVNTDNNNVKLPAYLSQDRCNSYKNILEENLPKSNKQLNFKEKIPVTLPITIIIMALITILPLFLSVWYFKKPENINKQIINPWFSVILAFILGLIGIYITILAQTKNLDILNNDITEIILLFSSLFFVVQGYVILASIQAKGYNFRDNYSEDFPTRAGFENRLVTWSKFSNGAVYFTNDEMIVVAPNFKDMDISTQIVKAEDIKNVKKTNRAIIIFISDTKYITLVPPSDIQTNIFINNINNALEKIRTEK